MPPTTSMPAPAATSQGNLARRIERTPMLGFLKPMEPLAIPITFPEALVPAVIHGSKRQAIFPVTSLVGVRPVLGLFEHPSDPDLLLIGDDCALSGAQVIPKAQAIGQCPWGTAGARLWLREAWAPRTMGFLPLVDAVMRPRYKADNLLVDRVVEQHWGGWRSASGMPRWASRLTKMRGKPRH